MFTVNLATHQRENTTPHGKLSQSERHFSFLSTLRLLSSGSLVRKENLRSSTSSDVASETEEGSSRREKEKEEEEEEEEAAKRRRSEEEEAVKRRRLTDARAANLRKNRVRHAISQCSSQVTRWEFEKKAG